MEAALTHHMILTTSVYAKATGRSPSTVGNLAMKDGKFFTRLADGGTFRIRTYDSLMAWLATNWPDGVDWPDGVPHPPKDLSLLMEHATEPTQRLKKRMTSAGLLYKSAS